MSSKFCDILCRKDISRSSPEQGYMFSPTMTQSDFPLRAGRTGRHRSETSTASLARRPFRPYAQEGRKRRTSRRPRAGLAPRRSWQFANADATSSWARKGRERSRCGRLRRSPRRRVMCQLLKTIKLSRVYQEESEGDCDETL